MATKGVETTDFQSSWWQQPKPAAAVQLPQDEPWWWIDKGALKQKDQDNITTQDDGITTLAPAAM